MIEAFWSRMQVEPLNRHRWRTRVELANAIFDDLESSHNRQRRHRSLGMLTPIPFEHASTVASESNHLAPRNQGHSIAVCPVLTISLVL
jgi:transposase InsO family protein